MLATPGPTLLQNQGARHVWDPNISFSCALHFCKTKTQDIRKTNVVHGYQQIIRFVVASDTTMQLCYQQICATCADVNSIGDQNAQADTEGTWPSQHMGSAGR